MKAFNLKVEKHQPIIIKIPLAMTREYFLHRRVVVNCASCFEYNRAALSCDMMLFSAHTSKKNRPLAIGFSCSRGRIVETKQI